MARGTVLRYRIPAVRTIILIRGAAVLLLLVETAVLAVLLFVDPPTSPLLAFRRARLVTSFETCRDLQFPVEETHPLRCTAGGNMFYVNPKASLRVLSPLDRAMVALPIVLGGEVKVGSGTRLTVNLLDRDGFSLVEDDVALPKALSGQIVPFRTAMTYPRPIGTGGTLVVSMRSRKGAIQERAEIPVRFLSVASVEVKAFFGNRERDPKLTACEISYPVARRVMVTEDLSAAALRELLAGPTLTEQRQGFFTNLPEGITVRSLISDDDRMAVEFSPPLPQTETGSCRAQAIRSQIERTLRQFPTTKSAQISIEGVAAVEGRQ